MIPLIEIYSADEKYSLTFKRDTQVRNLSEEEAKKVQRLLGRAISKISYMLKSFK